MVAGTLTFHRGSPLNRERIPVWAAVVILCGLAPAAQAQVTIVDGVGDAAVRRTDLGADGPVNEQLHRPPDIVSYTIGAWAPQKADRDLFKGDWDVGGDFFRLDIVFDGLINPPGLLGQNFNPFQHGPHPVFGYIEIDMDADVNTGGELTYNDETPGDADLRYTGAVGRYGGHPAGERFVDRVASGAAAFDRWMATPPYVDRGGEEFHLALNGWQIYAIDKRKCRGPCDRFFEEGEAWVVEGELFHRAHAYERFSFALPDGSYDPRDVQVLFEHVMNDDETTVSIVYPLTNAGYAAWRGEAEEPHNWDARDQNSVLEALDDLRLSARDAPPEWRRLDNFPIIAGWESKNPATYLNPRNWRVTILAATSYTDDKQDAYFVWTDHHPNVIAGDFNGDNRVDEADADACRAFIAAVDGDGEEDCDGEVNQSVTLCAFGPNFSLYDVNYDGLVDDLDCPCVDCRFDLADAGLFQQCFTGAGPHVLPQHCLIFDFDGDDDVDLADHAEFVDRFEGP